MAGDPQPCSPAWHRAGPRRAEACRQSGSPGWHRAGRRRTELSSHRRIQEPRGQASQQRRLLAPHGQLVRPAAGSRSRADVRWSRRRAGLSSRHRGPRATRDPTLPPADRAELSRARHVHRRADPVVRPSPTPVQEARQCRVRCSWSVRGRARAGAPCEYHQPGRTSRERRRSS